jgi:putative component of membrane protein insertase Oxa1/YidC/SpoIIIJ protein YidD
MVLAEKLSVLAIAKYQKHISPYKGFACAHRVLYGGESCSQYIKRVITEEGLRAAWAKSGVRFAACKQANLILHSSEIKWGRSPITSSPPPEEPEGEIPKEEESNASEPTPSRRRATRYTNNSDCPDCSALVDCASLDCSGADCHAPDCSSAHCHLPDCSSLDCSGADCSSLDCSGADCSSLDCGSCSG